MCGGGACGEWYGARYNVCKSSRCRRRWVQLIIIRKKNTRIKSRKGRVGRGKEMVEKGGTREKRGGRREEE